MLTNNLELKCQLASKIYFQIKLLKSGFVAKCQIMRRA